MLDPFIIEQLRRERAANREREYDRIPLHIEEPDQHRHREQAPSTPDPMPERGVTIVTLDI